MWDLGETVSTINSKVPNVLGIQITHTFSNIYLCFHQCSSMFLYLVRVIDVPDTSSWPAPENELRRIIRRHYPSFCDHCDHSQAAGLPLLSIHNYWQNGELPSDDTWPVTRAFNYSLVTTLMSGLWTYLYFVRNVKLLAPNTPVSDKIKKYF